MLNGLFIINFNLSDLFTRGLWVEMVKLVLSNYLVFPLTWRTVFVKPVALHF